MDGLDRLIAEIHEEVEGLDLTLRYAYDGLGNKVREVDPEGRERSWEYDTLGRLTDMIDAAGTVHMELDGEGLKTEEWDRRGVRRGFDYDNLSRLLGETLLTTPFSGVEWSPQIAYDDTPGSWKGTETDARGNDSLQRMIHRAGHRSRSGRDEPAHHTPRWPHSASQPIP